MCCHRLSLDLRIILHAASLLQGSDAFGATGYHGYWPADYYKLNPAFGSQQQLQALMQHCHDSEYFIFCATNLQPVLVLRVKASGALVAAFAKHFSAEQHM
jgi:hypothetical protein